MISDWLGIPAAIVAWGFALYVLILAPPTRGARFLVAMLFVDGLAVITSYYNLDYLNPMLEAVGLPPMPGVMHQVSDWALIAVYLPFLGMTLSSPLVKPLKNPIISNLILYGCLAIAVVLPFLSEEVRVQLDVPFYIVICIGLTWGFVAALHTWYIATNDAERERARAFALAFGVRDVLWTITFGYYILVFYGVIGPGVEALMNRETIFSILMPLFYELAVIIYVPLVAYGVLRVQLFDIDLRIKRTLKRGTVAAAFVATFFVISEFAGNYLSSQLGTVLGVLATGALVFFLDPIQRAAEKFSDKAMPNTVDTPEYESFRKLQVYDSAVRAALEDGEISKRQRRVLDSMIESMGIDPNVAQRMEEDTLAASSRRSAVVEGV
ncbi:MAG: hypothetical protein QNJ00_15120 [Woeseiaceae bacterium]|nr:hypothetical protein [Woeseiaceae bacterium]